jgi:hypothetical protein
MEQVNTLSQFDQALSNAFVSDKFSLVRKAGVLNCKEAWNKWLGYSRFGSTRHNSSEAVAQGGRQEEPMCMHFFLGKEPGNHGKVLMRYKFREDDKYWAPMDTRASPASRPMRRASCQACSSTQTSVCPEDGQRKRPLLPTWSPAGSSLPKKRRSGDDSSCLSPPAQRT